MKNLLRLPDKLAVTVTRTMTVLEAVRVMLAARVGAAAVVEGGRLQGIFTERDIMERIVLDRRNAETTLVSEIMTANANGGGLRGSNTRFVIQPGQPCFAARAASRAGVSGGVASSGTSLLGRRSGMVFSSTLPGVSGASDPYRAAWHNLAHESIRRLRHRVITSPLVFDR